jgi:PAS domain S-box-containing protein
MDMTITSWNAPAEKLHGYKAEAAIGQSVWMLVPEERIDEEPTTLRQIKAGQIMEPYETQRLRKDGRLIDVLLSFSPIRHARARIVGASKTTHDITYMGRGSTPTSTPLLSKRSRPILPEPSK